MTKFFFQNTMKFKVNVVFANILISFFCYSTAWAGSYIFAGDSNGVDLVAHPIGYIGNNQHITLNICIDAASQNRNELVTPIQNVVNTWNRLQETTSNVKANVLGVGEIDAESVLLHEVGHCIGLAHPNFSTSVISGKANNSTVTTKGANNVFELNMGADGIFGSADDIRGDDENLHWFNLNNNPFVVIEPVDQYSFQRTLGNLPAGDNFAVNADRTVSNAMGFPNTEATMQQTTFTRETQRDLAADDVSSLLFARTGLDRTFNTADDYTVTLNFAGIVSNASNATNCDVSVSIDDPSNFAFCSTNGVFLNASNVAITAAAVHLGTGINWYFNKVSNDQIPQANSILDFNKLNLAAYGGNQDITGTVSIEDGGASLRLSGNRWQQVELNYTVTADTVIELDFSSSTEAEIQGIGFNNTLNLNQNHTFQFFGSQDWGLQNYHSYSTSNGVQHYVIPVGQFYTGMMRYFFFVNDHDVSAPNGESLFSNIQIYENGSAPGEPVIISTPSTSATVAQPYVYDADGMVDAIGDASINFSLGNGPAGFTVSSNGQVSWTPIAGQEGTHLITIIASNAVGNTVQNFSVTVDPEATATNNVLNFNDYILGSYGVNQDGIGTVSIEDGGTSLRLTGNRWQQIGINYIVTANTVVEFDFSSSAEVEIHSLGFNGSLNLNQNYTFQLFGKQIWGIQNYHNYSIASGVQHYVIPVGQYYSGMMQYMFFSNDNDALNSNGESLFSNIQVYEK